MCSWTVGITVYVFEGNYDPKYLNLDPNDENSWKIYAEKVRDIMSKCLNIPKVNQGYRDAKKFKKAYQAQVKLLENFMHRVNVTTKKEQ